MKIATLVLNEQDSLEVGIFFENGELRADNGDELQAPHFATEEEAREWLEASYSKSGPEIDIHFE